MTRTREEGARRQDTKLSVGGHSILGWCFVASEKAGCSLAEAEVVIRVYVLGLRLCFGLWGKEIKVVARAD